MRIFIKLLLLFLCYSVLPTEASQCEKAIFIFVHGLFDTSYQSEQYGSIIDDAIMVSFDFDDAMQLPFVHRPFLSSLGQEDEIDRLNKVYESIVEIFCDRSFPVPPIVLVGVSRGASVILNFLATRQPRYVVAAICESPFDSIRHVAAHIASYYLPQRLRSIGEKLFFSCFFNHDSEGINPSGCVANINPNIPILLIASKEDVRVPFESTERLYKAMKKQKKNVCFKVFEQGKHAKILKENEKEYQEALESFLINYIF